MVPVHSLINRCGLPGSLGTVVFCILAILPGALFAQAGANRETKEPPKFELSAMALGVADLPPLFRFEESKNESGKPVRRYVPFDVPRESRSTPISLPLVQPVQLFTGDPDAPEGPKMTPFLQVPVKRAGDRLLLVFHLDENGRAKHVFIEDLDKAHPAGSVRVVNLTRQRIAVSAGGNTVPVLPEGQQIIKPVFGEDGRFPFRHFEERPGEAPYESPLIYLHFPREDMRLLVVFAPMPVEPERDESGKPLGPVRYNAKAVQIYDRQPGFVAGAAPSPAVPPSQVIGTTEGVVATQAASAVSSAPARECAVGVVAFGEKWAGGELELGIAGQSGVVRAALQPGTIVPVKVPVAGETLVALRSGGVPLGEVTVGGSMTNALLALAPPAHMEDPATFGLFETSAQSHPAGRVRVFNLTPYEMAFTTDKTPTYVNPRASALVPAAAADGKLPLKLALKLDGAWKLVDQTPRPAPGSDQRLGLFVFPSGSGAEAGGFSIVEKNL